VDLPDEDAGGSREEVREHQRDIRDHGQGGNLLKAEPRQVAFISRYRIRRPGGPIGNEDEQDPLCARGTGDHRNHRPQRRLTEAQSRLLVDLSQAGVVRIFVRLNLSPRRVVKAQIGRFSAAQEQNPVRVADEAQGSQIDAVRGRPPGLGAWNSCRPAAARCNPPGFTTAVGLETWSCRRALR